MCFQFPMSSRITEPKGVIRLKRIISEFSRYVFLLVVLTFVLSVLAACGGAQENQGQGLKVAYGADVDPADVADYLGLHEMEGMKVINLTEDSAVVSALIKGDVDIGNMGVPDFIKARLMGVPLKLIFPSNMRMEYVMVAQEEIKSVSDVKGKKVAFHAPGSGTEILQKLLVKKEGIPENEIEWITLPESPNRAAAMLSRRIDVTALDWADVLEIQSKGQFNILGSFHDVAPEAISSGWVVSEQTYEKKKDMLQQFVNAMARGYQTAAADKNAWLTKAKELLPNMDEERLSKTYDFYKQIEMFPAAPWLTQEMWKAMNDFYTSVGEYEDPGDWSWVASDLIAGIK